MEEVRSLRQSALLVVPARKTDLVGVGVAGGWLRGRITVALLGVDGSAMMGIWFSRHSSIRGARFPLERCLFP